MKQIILIFILTVSLIACSKKQIVDNEDIPKDIPAWLQTRIAAIKKDEGKKDMYWISKYRINGVIYYNISLIYQSCLLCDVYDESGNSVSVSVGKDTKIERVKQVWPVTE